MPSPATWSHLIDQRDRDVQLAMSDYEADGASEEYAAKEQRWHNVAGEVRSIIQVLAVLLASNDETADPVAAAGQDRGRRHRLSRRPGDDDDWITGSTPTASRQC